LESNWRFGVWNYGMYDSAWELAAHKLGTNYPTHRVIVRLSNGLGAEFNVAGPGQLPSLVNTFVPPVAHPHFPFGRLVDPD